MTRTNDYRLCANASAGRASAPFLILITAAICTFGYIMVDINRNHRQELEQKLIEKAEHDQATGNFQELPSDKIRRTVSAAIQEMQAAIKTKDNAAFDTAFTVVERDFQPGHTQMIRNSMGLAITHDFYHAAKQLISLEPICAQRISLGDSLWIRARNASSGEYLSMLLGANCGVQGSTDHDIVMSHLRNSHFPSLALSQEKDPERQAALKGPMLELAIENVRIEDALMLIREGTDPNYLANANRRTLLEKAVRQGPHEQLEPVAVALIDAGADTIHTNEKGTTRHFLDDTVRNGSVPVVTKILEKDPGQIKRDGLSAKLISILSDESSYPVAMLEILIDNGLVFDAKHESAQTLTVRAVRNGNLDVVRYLLELGVDTNQLYVVTTLLGEAKESRHRNAGEITKLLEDHGATDDVLAQARAQRSTFHCERNPIKTIPDIDKLKERVSENSSGTLDEPDACELVVSHCRNQGMGFDDCIASSVTCTSDSAGTQFCCPTDVVDKYFEARCAGLTVQESVYWLDYFPNTYGAPRVLSQ